MVESALGAAKAAAASSLAMASAAPAAPPKAASSSRPPAPPRAPAAAGAKVPAFVPTPSPRPAAPPVAAAAQSEEGSGSSSSSPSRGHGKRRRKGRRRSKGRKGGRKARRRSRSRGGSESGSQGRKRPEQRPGKQRSSIFTATAEASAGAAFAQPEPRRVQLSTEEVPDWLQDLAAKPSGPCRKKVIRMSDAFVKCLIGKGGETIRYIINRTGADIQVRSAPQDPEGIVSIVGNVDAAEAMIREVLASKGCYMPLTGQYAPQSVPQYAAAPGLALPQQADQDVLKIPSELVGLFIGAEGSGIKDIKAQVGGAVSIKVLAPILPGGFQEVQVVGDHWQRAKEIARQKIEEYKKITPGRWNMPGWHRPEGSPGAATPTQPPPPPPVERGSAATEVMAGTML